MTYLAETRMSEQDKKAHTDNCHHLGKLINKKIIPKYAPTEILVSFMATIMKIILESDKPEIAFQVINETFQEGYFSVKEKLNR